MMHLSKLIFDLVSFSYATVLMKTGFEAVTHTQFHYGEEPKGKNIVEAGYLWDVCVCVCVSSERMGKVIWLKLKLSDKLQSFLLLILQRFTYVFSIEIYACRMTFWFNPWISSSTVWCENINTRSLTRGRVSIGISVQSTITRVLLYSSRKNSGIVFKTSAFTIQNT